MVKKQVIPFKVGDYLILSKNGHRQVFKLILINYSNNSASLEITYPSELRKGLKGEVYFQVPLKDLSNFELLPKELGTLLYG